MMDLFGGAMRCVIPPGLVDVSAFREVPDNQEVWVAQDSDALVLVVEVAEYAAEVADAQAASYYFGDLAQCNEAEAFVLQAADARVSAAGLLQCPAVASVWACSGVQRGVSKFAARGQGDVAVWLAVARLPEHRRCAFERDVARASPGRRGAAGVCAGAAVARGCGCCIVCPVTLLVLKM